MPATLTSADRSRRPWAKWGAELLASDSRHPLAEIVEVK